MASNPSSLLSLVDTLPEEWHAFFSHTAAGGAADPASLQRSWRHTLEVVEPLLAQLQASPDTQDARREVRRAEALCDALLATTGTAADADSYRASLGVALLLPKVVGPDAPANPDVPLAAVLTTFVGPAAAALTKNITTAASTAFPVRFVHTDEKAPDAAEAGIEPYMRKEELQEAVRSLSRYPEAAAADIVGLMFQLDVLIAAMPPVVGGDAATGVLRQLAAVVERLPTVPAGAMGAMDAAVDGGADEVTPLTVYCQFPWAVGATSRWGMGRACEPRATRALDDVATEATLAEGLRAPRLEVTALCHTWDAWPIASANALRRCTMPILLVAADPAAANQLVYNLPAAARCVLDERFAETIMTSDLIFGPDPADNEVAAGVAVDADPVGSQLSQALFPWATTQEDVGAACVFTPGALLTAGRPVLGATVLCAMAGGTAARDANAPPARALATTLQHMTPSFRVDATAVSRVAARRGQRLDAAASARVERWFGQSQMSLVSARRVFLVDFAGAAACAALNVDIQVAAAQAMNAPPAGAGSPHAPANVTSMLDRLTVLRLTSDAPLSAAWSRLSDRHFAAVPPPAAEVAQPPNVTYVVLTPRDPPAPGAAPSPVVQFVGDGPEFPGAPLVDDGRETIVDMIAVNQVAWRTSGVVTALQSVGYGLFGGCYFVERAHLLRALESCAIGIAKPLIAAVHADASCPPALNIITEKINETRAAVLLLRSGLAGRRAAVRRVGQAAPSAVDDEVAAVTGSVGICAQQHGGVRIANDGTIGFVPPPGVCSWDVCILRAAIGLPEVTQHLRATCFPSGFPMPNVDLESLGFLGRDAPLEGNVPNVPTLLAPLPAYPQPSFLSFFHGTLVGGGAAAPDAQSPFGFTIDANAALSIEALEANYKNGIAFTSVLLRLLSLFELAVAQVAIEPLTPQRAQAVAGGAPLANQVAGIEAIRAVLLDVGSAASETMLGMLLALRACARAHGHAIQHLFRRITGVAFHVAAGLNIQATSAADASVQEVASIIQCLGGLRDTESDLTDWYLRAYKDLGRYTGWLKPDGITPTVPSNSLAARLSPTPPAAAHALHGLALPPPPAPPAAPLRPKAVLCFCGGGIRGVISAVIVQAMEKICWARYQLRIWDLVDEMVGTSTGALMAAFLCCGNEPQAIRKMYMTQGKIIFPKDGLAARLRELAGPAMPRYDSTLHPALIRQYLGNRNMNDQSCYAGRARPKLLTFQLAKRTTRVWTQADDVSFADVLTAACAGPTYFPAHRIGTRYYCDAGLCENHPGLQVMRDAPGSVGAVVCIGTGEFFDQDDEELHDAGLLRWGVALSSVVIGGSQQIAKAVLDVNFARRHVHLNPQLPKDGEFNLDSIDDKDVTVMINIANEFVQENAAELERAVTILKEAHDGAPRA